MVYRNFDTNHIRKYDYTGVNGMKEIIITNMEKISPKHHEHNQYEYYVHEVERNQTVTAFYTLPPGKSNYPFQSGI
jgi:hypothetical protein